MRYSGKAGSVTIGGTAINVAIEKWDLDMKCDAIDTTGMDSAGVKEFIPGLSEWSASCDGMVTGSITGLAVGTVISQFVFASSAQTGAPKFTPSTTSPAGSLIITGLKVTADMKDAVKVSLAFQGSGNLAMGVV